MNHARLVTARVYANELTENLTELLVLQRNGFDGDKIQRVEDDALYSIRRIAQELGLSVQISPASNTQEKAA